MKQLKWLGALILAALTASCGGGGGNAGTSPFGNGSGTAVGSAGGSASGAASGASGAASDAGTTAPPTASDLSLTLSATNVDNSGTKTVMATATAVDAQRNTLSAVPVLFSVDNNAVAQVAGAATGTDGTSTATVSIGSDRSNRLVTVSTTSGGLTRSATFQVTGAALSATAIPAVTVPGSTGNKIQYRLIDVNAVAMASQPIVVTAPGLADVSATTDTSGSYEYTYTAPATPGNLDVVATAGGARLITTVLLQPTGSGAVPLAIGPINSQSVSANPSVIGVNTSATSNRSEVRALFLGINNAPIKNLRVRFDLPDPNSIGGTLSTGSNTVYTDVNGVATTAYIPAGRSSPTDGVTVRACYSLVDLPVPPPPTADPCPNSVMTKLTVISEALAVSVGTDATIAEGTGGLTYVKKFVVLVVDSSGQAKAGVQLSTSIDLVDYIKGYYAGTPWNRDSTDAGNPSLVAGRSGLKGMTCPNEDVNRNGVLETQYTTKDGVFVPSPGEDINRNGQLDPRKSDVAISFVGSSVTSVNGTAILQIEYPKNVATWIDYTILVSASGVLGSEGRTSYSSQLPADVASFTGTTPPAFVNSPYGKASSCVDPG